MLDFEGPAPEAPEATTAAPGSEEKLRVLAERARQGLALFHAGDVTCKRPTGLALLAFTERDAEEDHTDDE